MPVKLWSPKGNMEDGSTHIGLTSGHSFLIPHGKEGVEVPARFRKEAIARGCLPVGMEDDEDPNTDFNRDERILGVIKTMFNGDDPNYFTKAGKPNLAVVTKLAGFNVDRSECDRLWTAFEKEQNDSGDDA